MSRLVSPSASLSESELESLLVSPSESGLESLLVSRLESLSVCQSECRLE